MSQQQQQYAQMLLQSQPSMGALDPAQLMLYQQAFLGLMPSSALEMAASDSADSSHTITKAPVLYKTTQERSCTSASAQIAADVRNVPDDIVRSYALMARASAIASQKPLENCAEAFLSAAANRFLSSSSFFLHCRFSTTQQAKLKARRQREQLQAQLQQQQQHSPTAKSLAEPIPNLLSLDTTTSKLLQHNLQSQQPVSSSATANWHRIIDNTLKQVIYIRSV
ncbi:hypothetical protein Ciccas_007965 [Cichlidogyrus casuarinus]|uniref:Uncharacterized protein n=1 Tax=Cichlidogyrus casuarinus TaxID=1844966 RepID=A0ABD2Q2I2_9PLAT